MKEVNQIKELLNKMSSADIELVIKIALKKLKEQTIKEVIDEQLLQVR